MANGNNGKLTPRWWFAAPFALVLTAWVICWAALGNDAERGTFGDMFGSVNALFSGLAFAGLIVAIRLQSEELALQRQELADTRTVLEDQKTQMEAQATTLQLQQFEATFFQLLRTLSDIVGAIDLVSPKNGVVTHGRDCIKIFYERLEVAIGNARGSYREQAKAGYSVFYKDHEHELGHYFGHLYHIIKFVDLSEVPEKRRYTSFVRAQLSSYESLMLFYNCLNSQGSANFKPLVEKYGLLKHVPRALLLPGLLQLFKPSAYLPENPDAADLTEIGAVSPEEY